MMRNALAACLALGLAGAATAATNPFSDVPRTHWAYEAIQKAVDAGILQGFDGKFHGEKLVNRYQMAVIIKKILDKAGSGGKSGSGMKAEDIKNLEALTIEFADELALLNVKVSTLEDSFVALRNEVDQLKRGGGASKAASTGLANAFTGFLSFGLISTDDGTCTGCTAGTPGATTRYTAANPDRLFFTLPQASIALDTEVGDGIGLHIQYDYDTDGPSAVNGAANVGLNEAYLFVDELFGNIGGKLGGFALPFQSWEYNGAFRTLNDTISPSAKGNLLEAIRAVGMEFSKTADVDPADIQWRFGIASHNDTAALAGAALAGIAGAYSDAAGQGALSGTASLDDEFGFYLDIESGNDPDRNWGWRLGFASLGGDSAGSVGPPAVPATNEADFWQIGFWWKNDDFKVVLEYIDADIDGATAAGFTPNAEVDAWYILVNWKMNDKTSLSLRYDDWENETQAAAAVVAGTEGDSFTFAWNRRISDTSMFQFEWLSVDASSTAAGATGDTDDDLVQFRYKVWF